VKLTKRELALLFTIYWMDRTCTREDLNLAVENNVLAKTDLIKKGLMDGFKSEGVWRYGLTLKGRAECWERERVRA
jgi:hypothetical protein